MTTWAAASDIINTGRQAVGYIDLKVDGQLFPSWILENFSQFRLEPIQRREGEDPCLPADPDAQRQLRQYQEFLGRYMAPTSPYRNILLYHGLGSGKTATAINLINILYHYDPNTNFVICIKASLLDDPWLTDLSTWAARGPDEEGVEGVQSLRIWQNLYWVHYDSPHAGRDFADRMKQIDTRRRTMFIIDESHNFIRNVRSNLVAGGEGRASSIYQQILETRLQNAETRVVLISATPAVNEPYEIALTFNLLRPGTFPTDESEFVRQYITKSVYPILNPERRNTFMRRILGLVSYYVGATPDLYATQQLYYEDLTMSDYQYQIYRYFEIEEAAVAARSIARGSRSKLYRTYTRQASNWVFPNLDSRINGSGRPRPLMFKITEEAGADVDRARRSSGASTSGAAEYAAELAHWMARSEQYLAAQILAVEGRSLADDLSSFREGWAGEWGRRWKNWWESDTPKSQATEILYRYSPKATATLFLVHASPGKAMIYTGFVAGEGIDVLKMYLRLSGFQSWDQPGRRPYLGYCEYHGRISAEDRVKIKSMYNRRDNIHGENCKVILLSPSATEGIQLLAMRMEIIFEPYWTEVRIEQVVGRGLRQCSHRDLPMEDREVYVYRLKVLKPDERDEDDKQPLSADVLVEDAAKSKQTLIQSFTGPMREAAVDCGLYGAHNKLQGDYPCFQFPQENLLAGQSGPAYYPQFREDIKHDLGLHAEGSKLQTIRVVKIRAVYYLEDRPDSPTSVPADYWYHRGTGIVYDYLSHQPLGRTRGAGQGELADKLDNDTWIFYKTVRVPRLPV